MLPASVTKGLLTHYNRHRATTFFAALNVIDGTVLVRCKPRHRHPESYRSSAIKRTHDAGHPPHHRR